MRFETRTVMLLHGDLTWCQEVTVELAEHRLATRWGCTPACVERLLSSARFDAALVDVDTLGVETSIAIAERLAESAPSPVVIAWGHSLDVEAAFALGRLGVRMLLRARPGPDEVTAALYDAIRTPPTFAPQVRGLVGHMGLLRAMGAVRSLMTTQALGLAFDKKLRAAELLSVSRQAVQQILQRRAPAKRPREARALPRPRVMRAG